MAALYDLVAMTVSSAPGTGSTISLGNAATINGVSYLSFANAGTPGGKSVAYSILDTAASELGTATYLSSGPLLTARTPTKSTNGNAAITASSAAIVLCSARAEDIISTDLANSFTAPQQAQARANIDAPGLNVPNTFSSSMSIGGTLGVTGNIATGGSLSVTGTVDAPLVKGAIKVPTGVTTSDFDTSFQDTPVSSWVFGADTNGATHGPNAGWWFQTNMRHANSGNYWGMQQAWGWEDNPNEFYTRNVSGGVFGSWVQWLNRNNFASYAVALVGNQTITGGFNVSPPNLGTGAGTVTPNPLAGNYQYITNNGAFTIATPTTDCAIDLLVVNGASAGTITFSGFWVSPLGTGDLLNTVNGQIFCISIRRILGNPFYVIKQVN